MTNNSHINLDYLTTTCAGSMEMVGQIVEMFLKISPASITLIKEAFDAQKWDDLKRESHKAKSSFLMMGAKVTGDKLAQVEAGSMDPDVVKLSALIDEIEDESKAIYSELKQALLTT